MVLLNGGLQRVFKNETNMTVSVNLQVLFIRKVHVADEPDCPQGLKWFEPTVVSCLLLHLYVESADLDTVTHSDFVAGFLSDDVHGFGKTRPNTRYVHPTMVHYLIHCQLKIYLEIHYS